MTVAGVSIKTLVLLAVLIAGGAWGWASATAPVGVDLGSGYANTTVTIPGGFWLASFGAFFLGIIIAVQPRRAALLGILYAVCEGFCLGAISAMFDAQTEGIVGAAILSTMCVFVVALLLYVTRIIKPTQKLAFAVVAGLGGLCLLVLLRLHLVDLQLGVALQRQLPRRSASSSRIFADRARRAEPGARLRHHRRRRPGRRAEGARVVPGVRADGHAHLAVHLDPQAARPCWPATADTAELSSAADQAQDRRHRLPTPHRRSGRRWTSS